MHLAYVYMYIARQTWLCTSKGHPIPLCCLLYMSGLYAQYSLLNTTDANRKYTLFRFGTKKNDL
jgi:hypothetical protein